MNLQEMSMQNNFYRDMINNLKQQINEFDRKIQANEIVIGQQLNDMNHSGHYGLPEYGCEMCMGECNAD